MSTQSGIPRFETIPRQSDLENDVWDDEYCCNYSSDGTKLLDAENFPNEVKVREGCSVICDGVFAFQDYMAEDVRLGEEVPFDDRNSFLDKISLPSSLRHIGKESFRECGYLLSVRLPKGLLTVGEGAFMDCWQLRSVIFPSTLISIGDGAFSGCMDLKKIKLGSSTEIIGEAAFEDCESLSEVFLPDSILTIGKDAFRGCMAIETIHISAEAAPRLLPMLPPRLRKKALRH
jgi:hypothetical protein